MTLMPARQKTPNYGALSYYCFFGSFKPKVSSFIYFDCKYIKIQNKPVRSIFSFCQRMFWEMDGKDIAEKIKM